MALLDWRPFAFSGIASVVAECATFPIDTTKTRLQVQGQSNCFAANKYRGVIHTLYTIVNEEGIRGLYKGLPAAVLRQSTYGTLKFGLYIGLKQALNVSTQEESLRVNVFCGIVAGVISSAAANPTDVLKVRMQARNQEFQNMTLIDAFIKIAKTEGVKGLWRGVIPTAQRAALVCGVEYPTYDYCKRYLLSGFMNDTPLCHFLSSAVAGAAGALASNPIEVVRMRLMNQQRLKQALSNSSTIHIYSNSFDCFSQTVRNEGVLALWKGTFANWLRLGPWCILFFVTYEQLTKRYAAWTVYQS